MAQSLEKVVCHSGIKYLFCATASLRAISKYTWLKVVNSDACRPCKSCKCMQ